MNFPSGETAGNSAIVSVKGSGFPPSIGTCHNRLCPSRKNSNTTCWLLGKHCGLIARPELSVSRLTLLPSMSILHRLRLPSRSEEKTMDRPSAETVGKTFVPELNVSCLRLPPYESI